MGKEKYSGIWVFAEQQDGRLNSVVFELLGKARELSKFCGESVSAILLGSGVRSLASELGQRGADHVIVAENDNLASYSARPYQQALTQLAEKYDPSIILYAATSLGRDLAPRMMVSLKTGLTADAIDLGFDGDGVFYQTTPAYGGSILANIVIPERRPQMATVHPGIFTPAQPDASRSFDVIEEQVSPERDKCYERLGSEPKPSDGIPIEQADVIVSGGRGIKSEDDLALLRELAELLDAQLASSRPLVDSGMLPHSKQIGQSGATVKPKLIVNVAISGSVQYQIGMQDSECIISINRDESAPIFDKSQYGIAADFRTLLPAIIAELKKRKEEK